MRALHVAASGMRAQQTRLDSVANNVANVGTTAYKRSDAAFEDVLYQEVAAARRDPAVAGSELGGGVRLSGLHRDEAQGAPKHTGEPLDVAVQGRGFLAFERSDGSLVYSRDGSLSVDSEGTLRGVGGLPVAGGIELPPDAKDVIIDEDGTVSVVIEGDEDPMVVGQLRVAVFANPNGLRAMGGNTYGETAESGDARDWEPVRDGQLAQYQLEGSNVDVASELIELIEAQRAYELNSKVVQAADESLGIAANLKR